MDSHKSICNNEKSQHYNYFIYQYIRTHGGWDQFTKEIIHECEVADKTEQRMVEQEWIKNNECELNSYRSYRTVRDLKQDKKIWSKKYREANKEKIREKKNQKFTCECGGKYTGDHKARHERTKKHTQFIEAK